MIKKLIKKFLINFSSTTPKQNRRRKRRGKKNGALVITEIGPREVKTHFLALSLKCLIRTITTRTSDATGEEGIQEGLRQTAQNAGTVEYDFLYLRQ